MQETGEVRNAELVLKRKDGSKIVVLENSRAVSDADGARCSMKAPDRHHGSHELSQQLSYEASHDALTGLSNRREFELRLQRALEMSQATGAEHAMLYLDLDRFKSVNDTSGHVAGDELLRQLGEVLQQRVRTNDVVARLGATNSACCCTTASSRMRSRSPPTCCGPSTNSNSSGARTSSRSASASACRDRLALQAPHAGDECGRLGLLLGKTRVVTGWRCTRKTRCCSSGAR